MSENSLTLVLPKNSNSEHLTYGKGKKSLLSEEFITQVRLFMHFHLTKSSIALYLRMRQMDKDCKKMVSELIHRHAV